MASFEDELLSVVEESFNVSDKDHKDILKLYKQSRDNIKQFLASLFMQYGVDGQIDFAEFDRLHMSEFQQFVEEETNNIAEEETNILPVILGGVLATTYYKTAYKMDQNLDMVIDFNLLRPEFIESTINFNWTGVPFSERIWDNRQALVKSLRTNLAQGLLEGESLDKIARRFDKQFDSKAYESQRLVRTESARVIDSAQKQIYEETGVVKEVQWLATLEENTCEECAELDGKRFRLDNDSKPTIPRHPNCRCTYIAVPYKGYAPEKRKDNKTKEIIQNMSYDEWARQKGIR